MLYLLNMQMILLMNKVYQNMIMLYYRLKTVLFYNILLLKSSNNNVIISPILISFGYLSLGKNVFIRNGARIEAIVRYQGVSFSPKILISDNVNIEQNIHLTCANYISIGKNTSISANVTITDINHPYENILLAPEFQAIEVLSVEIGEDCKLYNNVVILPGIKVGNHVVVGANTVVTKDIPDYCVAVGNPAKIIKRYNFDTKSWCRTNNIGEFVI